MTVKDFLKLINEEDMDKMMLWSDGFGWDNIKITKDDTSIYVTPDGVGSPFSSDK